MSAPREIAICTVCKKPTVEVLDWVDANTNRFVGDNQNLDYDHYFCSTCNKHTGQEYVPATPVLLVALAKNQAGRRPQIPVCEECGSREITYQAATAFWDVEAQKWTLSDDLSHAYCGTCEGECRIKFRRLVKADFDSDPC